MTEGTKLQFFGEAFILFNHFNVTGVRNQQYAVATVPAPSPTNPNPVNPCGSNYAIGQQCLVLQSKANAASTYFGLPNATSGQRIVQLGAKFTF